MPEWLPSRGVRSAITSVSATDACDAKAVGSARAYVHRRADMRNPRREVAAGGGASAPARAAGVARTGTAAHPKSGPPRGR